MKFQKHTKGIIFALLAAFSNASIGLFANIEINRAINPDTIAFYRCIIALIGTSFLLYLLKKTIKISFKQFLHISVCSLFGIFTLYFFETFSYQYISISRVTFLLMGTSAVFTFIIGRIFFYKK